MKNIFMIFLVLSLSWCMPAIGKSQKTPKEFVGVWELSRYDNLMPIDEPPYGMANFTYFFYEDGKYRFFIPGDEENFVYGRGNTPFKRYIPVSIKENRIKTWFGLTNDLHGEKTFRFITPNELEIELTDGSIAVLNKTLDHPKKYKDKPPVCAPYTVRGRGYVKSEIEKLRSDMRTAPPVSEFSQSIVGSWVFGNIEESGGRRFTFSADGKFTKAVYRKFPNSEEIKEYKDEGTYRLYGNILQMVVPDCRSPTRISIEGDKLRFLMDVEGKFILKREK